MQNAVPTFKTNRLELRGVTIANVEDYEKYFIDYEVISQLASGVPWPYPKDGIRDFIEKTILPNQGKSRRCWGIFLNEKPSELVGVVDLWREGKPENRGFWLGRPFWGRGLMTEAVEPVMDYAFDQLEFETLIFSNALGNIKSRRIKEKTGARLIGTRAASFVDPKYETAETWELSATDWRKRSRAKQ